MSFFSSSSSSSLSLYLLGIVKLKSVDFNKAYFDDELYYQIIETMVLNKFHNFLF